MTEPSEPQDGTATMPVKEPTATEEYAYIDRKEFTSEAFKIEIGNIPKFFGFSECKKLMKNQLKLNPHKIKHIPRVKKVYVTFRNEEDKIEALKKLDQYEYKKCILHVKSAKPKSDAMAGKRDADEDASGIREKRRKKESEDDVLSQTPPEMLVNSVTKWHNMNYEKQLTKKQSNMHEVLCRVRNKLGKSNLDREVFVWIMRHKNESNGACCPVNKILPSPVTSKYRNKSEFSIGYNTSGERTVGYRLGKYRDQTCIVENADVISVLPENMKKVASLFQQYIRSSNKEPYNPQNYEGHWRQLTVRETLSGEILATVIGCKKNQSEEEITQEKEDLKKFFLDNDQIVSTLLYQCVPTHRGSGEELDPPEVLFGNGFITEDLMGKKFEISPDAFFQCNTLAADVLYSTIGKLVKGEPTVKEDDIKVNKTESEAESEPPSNEKNIVLFDICCGTGTIGLTLANSVTKVVGIEMCEQAIRDANSNAKLNGILNAEFHCGKAEDLLPNLIKQYPSHSNYEIVAILDPPRPGIHSKVIQCLRRCPLLKKIIFVSCNPNACITNFFDLCRPASKRMPGLPFLPLLAQPIDLFPQTPHCELVVVFKRTSGGTPNESEDAVDTRENKAAEDADDGTPACEE